MIELKDRIIVDITDDLEHFRERRCTFQDINVCMHHVEFKLDNNETIHLKSHQANHFKRAEGLNSGDFLIGIIRLVAADKAKTMTLTTFIEWIINKFATHQLTIEIESATERKVIFYQRVIPGISNTYYKEEVVAYLKQRMVEQDNRNRNREDLLRVYESIRREQTEYVPYYLMDLEMPERSRRVELREVIP